MCSRSNVLAPSDMAPAPLDLACTSTVNLDLLSRSVTRTYVILTTRNEWDYMPEG